MGFFKRHTGRASYDLFSNYSHYVPGYGGMFMLLLMFLVGNLLGSLLVIALTLVSPEFAELYGTVISYPVMFIPACSMHRPTAAGMNISIPDMPLTVRTSVPWEDSGWRS